MQTCHLIGAAPGEAVFLPAPGDFIIAADGGLNALAALGLVPDFIVGDMDSCAGALPPGVPVRKAPREKDETDMQLALEEGQRRGFRRFMIHGGFGGRPDHTAANLQLLVKAARAGAFAELRCGAYTAAALAGCGELRLRGCGEVSVFAFGSESARVTLRGFKYNIENETLYADCPRGVSNALDGEGQILLFAGALLVFYEDRLVPFAPNFMKSAGESHADTALEKIS